MSLLRVSVVYGEWESSVGTILEFIDFFLEPLVGFDLGVPLSDSWCAVTASLVSSGSFKL